MSGRLEIVVIGPAPGTVCPSTATLSRPGEATKSPPVALPPVTFDRNATEPLALIAG